jgi:chaperonin GroES|tara:strand:+ start:243 stop:533 length:291 start_codon:yes stop_codon:yes gene_type:complete
MNIKPLYDRVLVKINSPEEKTKGGIIIPESTTQEKPQEGTVAAVGTGILLEDGSVMPLDVKKGDAVLFNKYGGMELSLADGEYVFLTQNEILGIIE